MRLVPGTRLGPYEITAPLGAGGMGEVYIARDTNLARDVAVKVLPDTFAKDPERLRRFESEAKALALLNHPNIATIHDFEQADDIKALVMELVEGPTLADRLSRGPIPVAEALAIAKQIAAALEAAHQQGIIHRDLKPANIKVRPDGTVKVLDFGLARVTDDPVPSAPEQSSTITAAGTAAGLALGTVAYMSPEQARGLFVGRHTDIWAFGAVLYEMLAGKRVFQGDSTPDIIAAAIRDEPDWTALPSSTPWLVVRLLRRCLHKDPRLRLGDIRDARWDLTDSEDAEPSRAVTTKARRPGPVVALAALSGAIAGTLLGGTVSRVFFALPEAPSSSTALTRLAITLEPPWQYFAHPSGGVAMSPDGLTVAYTATDGKQRQLFVRRLDQTSPIPLRETANGVGPVFSPDGRWIAFSTDTELKKIPSDGGIVTSITRLAAPTRGVFWAADNSIYFSLSTPGGIYRVNAAGGQPIAVTTTSGSEMFHRSPWLTESGELLYVSQPPFESGVIYEQPLSGGDRSLLLSDASGGRLTRSGQFMFVRQNDLFVIPKGLSGSLQSSEPRQLARNVARTIGGGDYAFSETGRLVYAAGSSEATSSDLVWVSRTGEVTTAASQPAQYENVSISPDGKRAALHIAGPSAYVAIFDFQTGETRRLTVQGNNSHPVWTPDGSSIAYRSMRPPEPGGLVLLQSADRGDEPRTLIRGRNATEHYQPSSWSGDGRVLIMENIDGTFHTLVNGTAVERIAPIGENLRSPRLSWDGRWLAYVSSEGGTPRVYVQPYPTLKGRWLVSPDGGIAPRWSRDGSRLFFLSGARMMEVGVRTAPSFQVSEPRLLFEGNYSSLYEPTRDGSRFLMIRPMRRDPIRHLTVISNWVNESSVRR